MKRQRNWLVVVALASMLGAKCGGGPPTNPHRLGSGRVIRVISEGQMNFPHGGTALLLSYQTDLKITQAAKLRAEVTDIWRDFQKEVDRAKLSNAIIMAQEVPTGRFVQRGKSFNFVFVRNFDGSWPQEPPK